MPTSAVSLKTATWMPKRPRCGSLSRPFQELRGIQCIVELLPASSATRCVWIAWSQWSRKNHDDSAAVGLSASHVGVCLVDGVNPEADGVEVRRRVSYLPGEARLPRHMRGSGVLKFFSEMHPSGNLDRSRAIADRLELNTALESRSCRPGCDKNLPCRSCLDRPTPLLILDEPTANLDPTVRATVLDLVGEAHDDGRTVMFSSHVLSEIEETCNRVAFCAAGRLAHELSISELFQRHRITADRPARLRSWCRPNSPIG